MSYVPIITSEMLPKVYFENYTIICTLWETNTTLFLQISIHKFSHTLVLFSYIKYCLRKHFDVLTSLHILIYFGAYIYIHKRKNRRKACIV